MNSKQKIALSIVFPIVCTFAGVGLASKVGDDNPLHLQETWWVWMIVFAAIGWIEYCLFNDQKEKD